MDKIKEAIMKVALGYRIEEVTEEYDAKDGELRLVKRKETRKDVPPDLKAAKLLFEEQDLSSLSDEELERERLRLLKLSAEQAEQNSQNKEDI